MCSEECGVNLVACSLQENQASQETFAQVRLRLSQSLYYKLLEGIVSDEEKKKTTDTRGTSTLQVRGMTGGCGLSVALKVCGFRGLCEVLGCPFP